MEQTLSSTGRTPVHRCRNLRPGLPPPRHRPRLHRAPRAIVDTKMRAVSAHGNTVDSLRVAVLAALNIADELCAVRQRYEQLAGTVQTHRPPSVPAPATSPTCLTRFSKTAKSANPHKVYEPLRTSARSLCVSRLRSLIRSARRPNNSKSSSYCCSPRVKRFSTTRPALLGPRQRAQSTQARQGRTVTNASG